MVCCITYSRLFPKFCIQVDDLILSIDDKLMLNVTEEEARTIVKSVGPSAKFVVARSAEKMVSIYLIK